MNNDPFPPPVILVLLMPSAGAQHAPGELQVGCYRKRVYLSVASAFVSASQGQPFATEKKSCGEGVCYYLACCVFCAFGLR